jgi:hypothetical protein
MATYKTYTTSPTGERIETASATPTINSENLSTQNPITLPPQPTDNNNYQGMIAGGDAMIGTLPKTTTTQPEWWTKYLDGGNAPTNPVNDFNSLYSSSGIDTSTKNYVESQKKLDSLNAELVGINAEATKQNLQLEGAGGQAGDVTQSFLNKQQQETNRQAAIKALPLQAQVLAQQAIVTGNQNLLNAAKEKLNTTFQLQQSYATQLYNYNKDIRDKVYEYASAQEKAKLDAQNKADDRLYSEQQTTLKNAQAIASEAMDNGQADIASQITALNPKSKTYVQDLAKLQAQIKNQTAELDKQLKQLNIENQQLQNSKLRQDLIPKASATTPEEANIEKENQILGLQDKITSIDNLLNDKAISSAVGPNILARFGYGALTGANQNFVAGVQQLVSKDTLDTLINLKKAGGTLGALSDQERIMLQSAASKIGTWAIRDNQGNVKGYNASEDAFKKELKTIKTLSERALKVAGGVPVESYLDTVDSVLSNSSNPYGAYIK